MAKTKTTKRKHYPDAIEAYLQPKHSKWITDCLIRGRRIALYGIEVCISQDGGKFTVSPVIPCAGPLHELIKANANATAFSWNGKKWKMLR